MGNLAFKQVDFDTNSLPAGFDSLPLLFQAIPLFSSFLQSTKTDPKLFSKSADFFPVLMQVFQNIKPRDLETILAQFSKVMPEIQGLLDKGE